MKGLTDKDRRICNVRVWSVCMYTQGNSVCSLSRRFVCLFFIVVLVFGLFCFL